MNDDKSGKFLFSTPMKHKKIQMYKRKKEEEEGDVYDQLSRILDDGSDDLKTHDNVKDNKKNHHKHIRNESHLFTRGLDDEPCFLQDDLKREEKFMDSNSFEDQDMNVHDTQHIEYMDVGHNNAEEKLHDAHNNNLTPNQQLNQDNHPKDTHNDNIQTGQSLDVNPAHHNEMSTMSHSINREDF